VKDGVITNTLEVGPSVGVRQRLFRLGVGNAQGGRGVFVEPYVGVGLSPMADVISLLRRPDGSTSQLHPASNPSELIVPVYAEAGVNVNIARSVAVGVSTRKVSASGGEEGGTLILGNFTILGR
jgi:hypothetical protein